MIKKYKIEFGILFVFLFIFATGCDIIKKDGKGESSEFIKGDSGLVMELVPNYPQGNYIVSSSEENIDIFVDIRNKGSYPITDAEKKVFVKGTLYLSGYDKSIIQIDKPSKRIGDDNGNFLIYLPSASNLNPKGGIDTAEFEGKIIANKILVDKYEPTILVTACYPYFTKASPTICIDPFPFDTRQEKVCTVGNHKLDSQGAPVAITRIDQEAASNKIQFKIHIENVGGGDVLKPKGDALKKCNPLGGGLLERKDFDRIGVESIKIGSVDLLGKGACGPFADNTAGDTNLIRLFNGKGFIICTLNVPDLGVVQSAYTTPIIIDLRYNYRSTISKRISIKKFGDGSGLPSTQLPTDIDDGFIDTITQTPTDDEDTGNEPEGSENLGEFIRP